MQYSEFELIVEALLFASPEPLTDQGIRLIFDENTFQLKEAIESLNNKYTENGNAFHIQSIGKGYQLRSRKEYDVWIRRLLRKSSNLRLSQAALETLAIVAYKQPLSRFNIESIRGVDCSGVLKTLLSKNLVKINGRESGIGRPLNYATTTDFLQGFGLNKISDLPKLREIKDLTENQSMSSQIDAFK
ncbi:MAG: SMC-Scp complex subunit ScpB [Candidatus Neomarinimicrobiota bacterium]